MPSINISEADFEAVAGAAMSAQEQGRHAEAEALDKVARKINAALSNTRILPMAVFGRQSKPLTWQDVPSTLR